MRFTLRHVLPLPPARAWSLLFSPAYEAALDQKARFERHCLDERIEDGVRHRHLKIETSRELPPLIAGVIGVRTLHYELIEAYQDDRQAMRWQVIPLKARDLLRAEGVYELHPGPTPDTSERLIEGEVTVSVPIVGSTVEKLIGKELEWSYEKSTVFTLKWLEDHN